MFESFKSTAKIVALSGAMAFSFGAAHAASITVSQFSVGSYTDALGTGTYTGENFEDLGLALGEGEVTSPFSTAVGTISTLGGTGNGGTVTGLPGNTGTDLALRDGNVFGRTNTTPLGGKWYLDSNDTWGMSWNVSTGGQFNRIIFSLADGSDAGAFLRISAGASSFEQRTGGKLGNGNISLVVIDFDSYVTSALVELGNFTRNGQNFVRNDGFSIDGLQAGIAPIPLPAAGFLLIGAVAGLGAMRKLRKA